MAVVKYCEFDSESLHFSIYFRVINPGTLLERSKEKRCRQWTLVGVRSRDEMLDIFHALSYRFEKWLGDFAANLFHFFYA